MRSFVWSEFLSSKGEEYEEIEDGSELKLGDAPWHPLWISRTIKRQSLGMPKASPLLHRLSWGRLYWTKFLSLYILCAMLGASFYFQFCLLFFWSYTCLILALFVWDRDTLRFFIWILPRFAYIYYIIKTQDNKRLRLFKHLATEKNGSD